MKDIADLAADELGDILEKHDINLSKSRIEEIIMSARKKVYFHIINSENKEWYQIPFLTTSASLIALFNWAKTERK